MHDGVVGGIDLHEVADLRRVDEIGKRLSEPGRNLFDDNLVRTEALAEEAEETGRVVALEPENDDDGEEKD